MQPLYRFNNPMNKPMGYRHSWYAGNCKDFRDSTKANSAGELKLAFGMAEFNGVTLPNFEYWRPVLLPCTNSTCLYKGAVIVHSVTIPPTTKKVKMVGVPSEFLSIIARTPQEIYNVAKNLELPLDDLVLKESKK